ncbi:DUF4167 domain-containing protein [Hyphomicrobium sp. MC8b]|uniref:DUF4167 domain-containing protein n=1 Tax=Hyphomicrobium sp. MC8b TaxID=300273 RepID=UPI00391D9B30
MRSFESSGPDVKIRGTPSHIAEKYISLARDALSSGDPVLAENYLQHAEHYNRIILGYREQMAQQGGVDPMGNGAARTHSLAGPEGADSDEFGDEDGDEFGGGQQQAIAGQGNQPDVQPPFPQQQRNFDNQNRYDNRQPRHERFNNNRHDRGDRGDRQDFRGDRGDRYEQRNGQGGEGRFREDRRPQHNGNGESHQGEGGFRRRERYQAPSGAPNGVEREPANGGSFQPSVATSPAPAPAAERERPERAERPERSERAERSERPERSAPQAAASIDQQEQPAFLRRPVRRPRREEPAEAPAVPPAANEDSE